MLYRSSNCLSGAPLAVLTCPSIAVFQRCEGREKEGGMGKKTFVMDKGREEHIQEVTSMDLPMDWENVFNTDPRAQGIHTDSIPDALVICLTTLGKVDIEYISSITGAEYRTVIDTLKGSIFQNPDTWEECFYRGWETAEEYLSGNLMRKWNAAKTADREYHGYFAENVRAIEKVLPPAVTAEEIYVTLGSPWVPADVIDDFIYHLFGSACAWERYPGCIPDSWKTIHDEITGTWEIPEKSRYEYCETDRIGNRWVYKKFGTDKTTGIRIIEKTLNMKPAVMMDEVSCPSNASGVKKVINRAETASALEEQKRFIREFQKWVWTDADRKKRLEEIYEDRFGCVRQRTFSGSFLSFPGMSSAVSLYPYQKDAVARIIFSPNTLLAHDVGAGKTYVLVAAGQELRRMGLSEKNLYVVPNNIVGQWKTIFLQMYPDANLLIVNPGSFSPKKRDAVLRQIRDQDYDGIIMAYSCFSQISLSKEYHKKDLKSQKARLENVIRNGGNVTAALKRRCTAIGKELDRLYRTENDREDRIYFDDLGITRIFVDEAHNFKNVPIRTKAGSVLGISCTGSKKCRDMMDKVHMIQKRNGGTGAVFATGTPITNSITDVFVMQHYLQEGELAMLDLESFDSWVGMFAERVTEFEIDVDTSSYRLATRFSKFHNLPELTSLLASIADFHTADGVDGIPAFDGYKDALISKTPEFEAYLDEISKRADAVRSGLTDRKEDNMLKITTDGRKAALDMRLVAPSMPGSYQTKAARCAENVADLYFRTIPDRSAQIIFCDTSTPKEDFNLYSEMKRRLVMLHVPEDEIAFVHDADTEAKRSELFARVRRGDVRVLIGSTFKLGIGVNIQERLAALHHLDIPWRPADMTQREGRILRQGNTSRKVFIYRYITEGSFDAYSWQLLETKQRFISDLLSGSVTERSGTDIEDTVLDYAQVKALAVGNPLVKERVETANELSRCKMLQHKLVEVRIAAEKALLELPGKIRRQEELIEDCRMDLAWYGEWKETHPPVTENSAKAAEAANRQKLREKIGAAVKENVLKKQERLLTVYRGFRIVLPSNMICEKPAVWLERKGRYYVELGDTDTGNLVRIDHVLDRMDSRLIRMQETLAAMRREEAELRETLKKKENFTDQIEACRKKLEDLDQRLGVDQNE